MSGASLRFAWGAPQWDGGRPEGEPFLPGAQGTCEYENSRYGFYPGAFGPTTAIGDATGFVDHYFTSPHDPVLSGLSPTGFVGRHPIEVVGGYGMGVPFISDDQREGTHTYVFWIGGVKQPVQLVLVLTMNEYEIDDELWYSDMAWYEESTDMPDAPDIYVGFWTLLRNAEETP